MLAIATMALLMFTAAAQARTGHRADRQSRADTAGLSRPDHAADQAGRRDDVVLSGDLQAVPPDR